MTTPIRMTATSRNLYSYDRGVQLDQEFVDDDDHEADGYHQLWRAVLLQALHEAMSFDTRTVHWLIHMREDVEAVIDMAGLNRRSFSRERLATLILGMARVVIDGGDHRKYLKGRGSYSGMTKDRRLTSAKNLLRSGQGRALASLAQLPDDPEKIVEIMLAARDRMDDPEFDPTIVDDEDPMRVFSKDSGDG